MFRLDIPGYTEVVEGEIYSKGERFRSDSRSETAVAITRVTRIRIPDKTSIQEYVINATRQVRDFPELSNDRKLIKAVRANLDRDLVDLFAKRNHEVLEDFDQFIYEEFLPVGAVYVRHVSGLVSLESVQEFNNAFKGRVTSGRDYECLLDASCLAGVTEIRLRVCEDGDVPKERELEYLLHAGVKQSYVFEYFGTNNHAEVAGKILALRDCLKGKNTVDTLTFNTEELIEELAQESILDFARIQKEESLDQ